LIGRDSDVDDLVQETFAIAFTTLDRLKDARALSGWLSAILVRSATKLLRRRRLLARLGLWRGALAVDVDALVSPAVPADHALELRRVYALASMLPETLRVPLVLRRVEGLPLEEVAALTGTSLATVKRRVSEAEDRLRAQLTVGGAR
jgi:RNA polymerase sigma-70 factor (ECF subfamily)